MLDFTNKTISVDDNATGTDLELFKNALTVARTKKSSVRTLGKFGFGMKSACYILGGHVSIVTATAQSDMKYGINYNGDEWIKDETRTWKNFK